MALNTHSFTKQENSGQSEQQNITLFCLPFSGGNVYSYRKLEPYLAHFITPVALELPGHGKRLKEPLLTNIHDMVEDLFHQIKRSIKPPYAIYGHSMGTILGYLLTLKILRDALPMPVHLFFSGRGAPSAQSHETPPLHLLPKEQFIAKIVQYGGIPKEIAAEKDLMELFVPVMRADFQALAEYTYQKEPALDILITVMIGVDEGIPREEILMWQEITTQSISIHQFPGGHFFIFDHPQEVGDLICRTFRRQG